MSTVDAALTRSHRYPAGVLNPAVLLVLALWLALIVYLGALDSFHAEPGTPPVATLAAMAGPPILFLMALRSLHVRRWALSIDPVWLAAIQGLRILGAGFLVAWAFGHLPWLFAMAAGWGDVLVALLAPFAAVALARNAAFLVSRSHFWFHVLGMLDFVGAVLTGLISRGTIPLLATSESTSALGQFPLLLIPCFAVPVWICLHIIAFVQIAERRKSVA